MSVKDAEDGINFGNCKHMITGCPEDKLSTIKTAQKIAMGSANKGKLLEEPVEFL